MKFTYMASDRFEVNIVRLPVIKETKATIIVLEKEFFSGEEKEKKYVKNGSRSFHETWEEARGALLENAQFKLQHARRQLELSQAAVGNIKGMKEPG